MAKKDIGHSSLAHTYILVLAGSLAVGLFLPQFGKYLFPYVTYLLGCIFFFSSLKLHLKDVTDTIHDWRTIALTSILKLIIFPVVVYQVTKMLVPDLAFAFLILAAMPTAMTAPLFTLMAHGKQSFSLVLSIITSLIVPLSAPFMIGLLAPSTVTIDITGMALRLSLVILIPIILAEFIKHGTPKIGKKLISFSRAGSLTALGLLLIGVISVHASTIIDAFTTRPTHYTIPLIIFFLATHLIGYFLFFWLPYKKRVAATVSIAYMNFSLAIYIASTFFPEEQVLLPIIISSIPWSIAIIPFAEIAARHEQIEYKS